MWAHDCPPACPSAVATAGATVFFDFKVRAESASARRLVVTSELSALGGPSPTVFGCVAIDSEALATVRLRRQRLRSLRDCGKAVTDGGLAEPPARTALPSVNAIPSELVKLPTPAGESTAFLAIAETSVMGSRRMSPGEAPGDA